MGRLRLGREQVSPGLAIEASTRRLTAFRSWEPEANVAECQRLLKSFWAEFEDHERDYAVGDVMEPSKKWIS